MRKQSIALLLPLLLASAAWAQADPDLKGLAAGSAVEVRAVAGGLEVVWPASFSPGQKGAAGSPMTLRIGTGEHVKLEVAAGRESGKATTVFSDGTPVYTMQIGKRDLKPSGWTAFFDRVDERPYDTVPVQFSATTVSATSTATRAVITLGPVIASATGGTGKKAGDPDSGTPPCTFEGTLQFTIVAGSPLIQMEAVLSTATDSRAILYDASLSLPREGVKAVGFQTYDGKVTKMGPGEVATGPVRTHMRTMLAETSGGSVALFPPPHQFLYPLDFANNFGFNDYAADDKTVRLGVRQPPHGDGRYRPWVNAPPGTQQRLCLFIQPSPMPMEQTLDAVRAYTRDDRVPVIPGYKSMVSHMHVEHTYELLRQQRWDADPDSVPWALQNPGWVQIFKQRGVQIVHLAEFHAGDTPKRKAEDRVTQLKLLHSECDRLSDENFLVLPGEEPNVHLGGHWISFFPKPVYWVLNRAEGEPFVETRADVGKLYRIGNSDDMLKLMEAENGLMWTAHPRVKGSLGFPDAYMKTDFFASPHFFGGAWKAMPADYSIDRLGTRVFNLLDDMSNRGFQKHIFGEIDLFQLDPTFELYGHMNVNYVQLPTLPKFKDGWGEILDAMRAGKYFTTTGEVLLTDVTLGGAAPGTAIAKTSAGKETALKAHVQFTFAPAFAEVVSGDGEKTYRQRIDLSGLPAFATHDISVPVDLAGKTWARLEVWDIARNGAFTQNVWIKP